MKHSSKPIEITSIGKSYYTLEIDGKEFVMERSEVRELIGMLDNTI